MPSEVEVTVEKLVHGGQGIATLSDGRKVFVWNALPGERVVVRLYKKRRTYLEGMAVEVLEQSPQRIEPRDEAYLSTSPWQIMTFDAENTYKQEILEETFLREHVAFGEFRPFIAGKKQWHYRNKMEYSFWGDEGGLHMALYQRASHGKLIVEGCSLAMPVIDEVANNILSVLGDASVRASLLKTLVLRSSQEGSVVAALFVKDESFQEIHLLGDVCKGLVVYYSDPKSPASVATKELFRYGDIRLTDVVHSTEITYDVNSFFQVNSEVFGLVADAITQSIPAKSSSIDMYAGVGTIGLCVGGNTILVESDPHNCDMARLNHRSVRVIEAPAEKSLEYVDNDRVLIIDPPRAGLHAGVINRIRDVKPPKIVYLSCNPITQARDIALIHDLYEISSVQGYNFFPRTPHIESLAILERKS